MTTKTNKYIGTTLLVCNSRNSPSEIWYWPPYMQGKERLKKETGHSKLGGARFNKHRNLHTRLFFNGCKTSKRLHPPARTLKLYIELQQGSITCIVQIVPTPPYTFKAAFLKQLLVGKQCSEQTFQGQGRVSRASDCLGPACGSTSSPILSMTSSNTQIKISVPILTYLEWFYQAKMLFPLLEIFICIWVSGFRAIY